MSAALDLAAASAAVGLSDELQRPVQGPGAKESAPVQRPRLVPTDIPGVGPSGWAMVADSGEHPDRRIPYAARGRKPVGPDGLTNRQREVLVFIASLPLPPTLREIGKHFGCSSTNAIAGHLAALAKKGMLVRLGTGGVVGSVARGIELTPAGREAAGLAPAPASDADLEIVVTAWAKLSIGQRRDVAAYARRLVAS